MSALTGKQAVILIDEYDSPLQHSWKTPQHDACTAIYKSVFAVLKKEDEHERFVFITGITKFTQISLFSVLNNLMSFVIYVARHFSIPHSSILSLLFNNMVQSSQANYLMMDKSE